MQNSRLAKVSVSPRNATLAALIVLAASGLAACGGGGHRAHQEPPSIRALNAWQDATIGYDSTLNYCVGDILPGGPGFWRRCMGRYRVTYLRSADALVNTSSRCGATARDVHTLVTEMSTAFQRAWSAGRQLAYVAQDFEHRKVHGPGVAYVLPLADGMRERAVAMVPKLTAELRRSCQ